MSDRETMHYDVVIVGAGPAGLATAIKLKQLCKASDTELSVCILEKGATIGAHILSGAVFEPSALTQLIPDWAEKNAPLRVKVTFDKFYFLTKKNKVRLPVPPTLHNAGNYIISLGELCKWLAEQAEALGVEIYPGFAAADLLIKDNGVHGVITNDLGINKKGDKTDQYQPGMEIHAKQVVIAEGVRGSLARKIIETYQLNAECSPQTYGLGVKEIWRVAPEFHQQGLVVHTVGWPLPNNTYGGSFIYHIEDCKILVGYIVGLDYENPFLSPFEESQRFKLHPSLRPMFASGERLHYGAKAISEGGYQSIPKLVFPGGLIVGDSAGFVNVAKIKGSHNAIKSGIVAATSLFNFFKQNTHQTANEVLEYPENLKKSEVMKELYTVRNLRPSFKKGLIPGLIYSGLDAFVFRGRVPWTFTNHSDHKCLSKASDKQAKKIDYAKPDNKITFDRMSSVYLSNTHHNEDQPAHLTLKDPNVPVKINYREYGGPEQFYCPAGVYEYLKDTDQQPYLQINAQNCLHCKTCDIKDITQNIVWTCPEGGGGPNYKEM